MDAAAAAFAALQLMGVEFDHKLEAYTSGSKQLPNPGEVLSQLQSLRRRAKATSSSSSHSTSLRGLGSQTDEDLKNEIAGAKLKFYYERLRPPTRLATSFPRIMLEESFAEQRRERMADNARGEIFVVKSYSGGPKTFSRAPVDKLESVLLKDMWCPKVHIGKYLLARIVSVPVRELGVRFLIEDQAGDVQQLACYNLPHIALTRSGPDLDALFPVGAMIVVKEPFAKSAISGNDMMIRVDSPTDIVWLSPDDPLVTKSRWLKQPSSTAKTIDYKAAGNRYFQNRKYNLAELTYSRGILSTPPNSTNYILMLLNRAEANLQLQNFASAFRDATRVLSLIEDNGDDLQSYRKKAINRRARAEYSLGLYDTAEATFAMLEQEFPDSKEVAAPAALAISSRRREIDSGEFDWVGLYDAALKSKSPRPDVANFHGPIRLEETGKVDGSRRVVAEKAINAGDLVLVDKAFAATYPSELDPSFALLGFDLETQRATAASEVKLTTAIAGKAMDSAAFKKQLDSLFAGPKAGTLTLEGATFETFNITVEQAIGEEHVDVDMSRIEGVATYNQFAIAPTFPVHEPPPPGTDFKAECGMGLFAQTALFNHACVSNAYWFTYGDVMVVRARTAIAPGEEIFIGYCPADESYAERNQTLSMHFPSGDGCPCALCSADRRDGEAALERRTALLAKLQNYEVGPADKYDRNAAREVEKLINQLVTTYDSSRSQLRPEMFAAYQILANHYKIGALSDERLVKNYVAIEMKVLTSIGLIMGDVDKAKNPHKAMAILRSGIPVCCFHETVMISITLAGQWASSGDILRAGQWMRAAIYLSETLFGGGRAMFMARYYAFCDRGGLGDLARNC